MIMRFIIFLLFNVVIISSSIIDDLESEKARLLKNDLQHMVGHDIVLSDSELKVNKTFMELKLAELERDFKNLNNLTFYNNFFEYKDRVKGSKLFKLIKRMPKGALLHGHDTGMLNADYMLTLTYWDNLYVCFKDDRVDFRFANTDPNIRGKYDCGTGWQLMKDARNSSADVRSFDTELKKHFCMIVENPSDVYIDVNVAWYEFQNIFIDTSNLVCYKPAWEQYFYDTLKALREDGIMYFEIRSVLPSLYDLDGNTYDAVETAEAYKKVVDRFKNDYPDFFGVKLIYAPMRQATSETVRQYITIANEIDRRIPGFLAGFDLVGQEDLGQPLKAFLPELAEAKEQFNLFFHAGETNWNGLMGDENLYDAIALGAKRIGHGYSLIKHPYLMDEIKRRSIALEVNVISNFVLKLIADLRNHPLATWLLLDLPVVISSDDPGLWGAEMLTHDFYVVFTGISNRHAGLSVLKKLALNSLIYSTYPDKDKIIKEFEVRWKLFIDSVLNDEL